MCKGSAAPVARKIPIRFTCPTRFRPQKKREKEIVSNDQFIIWMMSFCIELSNTKIAGVMKTTVSVCRYM
ncbi:hypothetical protein M378DRAFT_160072 [Amanita muscaria Koide BX008]|uniref:Uncharacterized protein n=1 Tax=Amanita muscaria (strain Koide BX008) TaxID=946122 RepID=A0A0C2TJD5_AMAMK|nr:hypothetical protein M378DRAFT_160072 [Amanita muscaria Koide BX008]